MASPRTLKRRAQRLRAKTRPPAEDSKFVTPKWVIRESLSQLEKSLSMFRHFRKP